MVEKKLQFIKSDVLVPIEISSGFYTSLQQSAVALLEAQLDPKQALINIDKAQRDPNFKLSVQEFALLVQMTIIHEVESVAFSDKDKYVSSETVNVDEKKV